MTDPEHLHTPENESEKARSNVVGAAACLAVTAVFATAGSRLDGIESMSCGIVAGVALIESLTCTKNGLAHYQASRELRIAKDHSREHYDGQ